MVSVCWEGGRVSLCVFPFSISLQGYSLSLSLRLCVVRPRDTDMHVCLCAVTTDRSRRIQARSQANSNIHTLSDTPRETKRETKREPVERSSGERVSMRVCMCLDVHMCVYRRRGCKCVGTRRRRSACVGECKNTKKNAPGCVSVYEKVCMVCV